MSDENSSPDAVFRDGTSQAARRPVALDPSYVSVDERSIQDFLTLLRILREDAEVLRS